MLKGLVKLSSRALSELHKHLGAHDRDGDGVLSFAEFLCLMRKLQDQNWGDINIASAEIAEHLDTDGNTDT